MRLWRSMGLKMAFYQTITQPALEPVILAEAKEHAIIDESLGTDDDNFITSLIVAARQHVEISTRKALITRTVRMTLDSWACARGATHFNSGVVEIKRGPFQAVTAINTVDEDDVATLWASTEYYSNQDATRGGGVLATKGRSAFPVPARAFAGIQVDFTAGYGDAASDVPSDLKTAIKMLVAHWYEHREAVAVDEDAKPAISAGVPNGFDTIISSHRAVRLI